MTATATTQEPEGSELDAIFRHLFGAIPEHVEYEYVRVPGLHLPAELDDVIEPGADYVVWLGGEMHDGRKLLVVYCRREKVDSQPLQAPAPPPATAPAPAAPTAAPQAARQNGRKRTR
jgi:hypothetical protein